MSARIGYGMDYEKDLFDRCQSLGRTETIGRSVLGREIYLVHSEKKTNTLVVCATHAREHVTTDVLFGLFWRTGLFCDFLPVHNPDGVCLAKYGAESVADRKKREWLIERNGKADFSLWKANANAVDLNVNFDARWGSGDKNVFSPAGENYVGPCAESEPETVAVADLIRRGDYSQVVSFHTKGEVIYWGFSPNFLYREEAERFAKALGYGLETAKKSCGGLKDYYDLYTDGLGLTVELGEDRFQHPYPTSETDALTEKLYKGWEILYDNGERIAATRRDLHGRGP